MLPPTAYHTLLTAHCQPPTYHPSVDNVFSLLPSALLLSPQINIFITVVPAHPSQMPPISIAFGDLKPDDLTMNDLLGDMEEDNEGKED